RRLLQGGDGPSGDEGLDRFSQARALADRGIRAGVSRQASAPPSTISELPMTGPAASEQSHSTASAISSGVATLPRGVRSVMAFARAGSDFIQPAIGGVATQPGEIAVTRTPVSAYWRAALAVRPSTPCLAAA